MSTADSALALYKGSLFHERRIAPKYQFRYRIFSVLADIDRLGAAAKTHRLFSHNRFNLVSLYDRDHGPKDGSALRPWIDQHLHKAGVDLAGGRVLLLCYPRILGYVFNPLSVWFCYHADGSLRAVLAEVRNTFNEWHGYLLHEAGQPMEPPIRDKADKVFHVSPFLPKQGHYRFRILPPEARYGVTVNWHETAEANTPALIAVQTAERVGGGDKGLLRLFSTVPLMTLKVIFAIHWQAIKIWLRGGRFHRKPKPPGTEISG